MERTLLEHPLVMPSSALHAATTREEAARLCALEPSAYWLEIAKELAWDRAADDRPARHARRLPYFAGAYGNASVNCLDRWPAERVALRYEREDGMRETWTYGQLTDAVARFAAALEGPRRREGRPRRDLREQRARVVHRDPRVLPDRRDVLGDLRRVLSASAVRDRLEDAQPKVVVVTDATLRRGARSRSRRRSTRRMKGLADPARDRRAPGRSAARAARRRARLRGAARADDAQGPAGLARGERAGLHHLHVGHDDKPKGLVHAGLGFLVGAYANVKWSLDLDSRATSTGAPPTSAGSRSRSSRSSAGSRTARPT